MTTVIISSRFLKVNRSRAGDLFEGPATSPSSRLVIEAKLIDSIDRNIGEDPSGSLSERNRYSAGQLGIEASRTWR